MIFNFAYPKIKIENQNGSLTISILSREGVRLGIGPILIHGTAAEDSKPLDPQEMIKGLISDSSIEIPLQYLYFDSVGSESVSER